jgi:hypothetical protein
LILAEEFLLFESLKMNEKNTFISCPEDLLFVGDLTNVFEYNRSCEERGSF